jgi:hypothetical protein
MNVSSLATAVRASVAIPGENFPTDGLPAWTLQENRVIAPPTVFTSTQLANSLQRLNEFYTFRGEIHPAVIPAAVIITMELAGNYLKPGVVFCVLETDRIAVAGGYVALRAETISV